MATSECAENFQVLTCASTDDRKYSVNFLMSIAMLRLSMCDTMTSGTLYRYKQINTIKQNRAHF
jgi:hypothetical protein